jgi:hypothetical protein
MNRREFLKFGGTLAAVAVGGAGGASLFRPTAALAADAVLSLTMVEADAEMVDGVVVRAWAFQSNLAAGGALLGARIPGPTIFVTEGATLRVRVRNEIPAGGPHGFAIEGVVDTGPLAFGEEVEVSFVVPAAGTWLYLDPRNAPVNRVMGLHGALVSLPPPVGFRTPYRDPTAAVRRLFDDLGTTAHFPGHFWDRDRNAVWIFATVDPSKNAAAAASAAALAPAAFLDGYLPQYFTINGKSGFFGAQHGGHDDDDGGHGHGGGPSPDAQAAISIAGTVGQPCLVRTLNAGLMVHSPHIHGNHVYELTGDAGEVLEDLLMVDTWTVRPLARKDVLLPFIRPPDVPGASWLRFEQGASDERFPLVYPMHDHNEISQTAAGANYPQGLTTHWQLDGPVDPHREVIQIDRAEVRLRTGGLLVAGRASGAALRDAAHRALMIHAGADASGPTLGTVTPGPDGRFEFRGRALQALASRLVTVHSHHTGAERRALPLTLR